MITAHLHRPATTTGLFLHPVWELAFAALRQLDPDAPDGTLKIQGDDLYIMLQGYTTQDRDRCRYEAHRRYLDIQLILRGSEIIEVSPLHRLQEQIPYDGNKDVAFFRSPEVPGISLRLGPGDFAIFYPEDAHMPKIQDRAPAPLRKAVVKIHLKLFA